MSNVEQRRQKQLQELRENAKKNQELINIVGKIMDSDTIARRINAFIQEKDIDDIRAGKYDNIEVESDVVREPSHYKQGRYEVIDEMLIVFGPQKTYDFCVLNAWKYRARAQHKGNLEQDLAKANRYLEMAKEIIDKHSSTSHPSNWCQMPPVHLIMEGKNNDKNK